MVGALLSRKTLHLLLCASVTCPHRVAGPISDGVRLEIACPACALRHLSTSTQTSDTKWTLPEGPSSIVGRAGCKTFGPLDSKCGTMLCGLARAFFLRLGVAYDDCFAPFFLSTERCNGGMQRVEQMMRIIHRPIVPG
jgi:hypothetical protein